MRRVWCVGWVFIVGASYAHVHAEPEPRGRFPNGSYAASELFRPLSIIRSSDGAGRPRGHSNVAVVHGYLVVPYAVDSGKPGGGLSVYDVSRPRAPVLVARVDEPGLREAHGFGWSSSGGHDYGAFQAIDGLQIWDFTHPTRPQLVSRLTLPGISASDYDRGAWWLFWQAPYVYVAGSGNGLYVVDAADVRRPRFVRRVEPARLGGFRLGTVFALGNLMVLAANDQPGLATVDISDPENPTLIASTRFNVALYSSILAGTRILGAGNDRALHVYDVSDPERILVVNRSPVATGSGKGGYVSYQDGFAIAGFSSQMVKIDIRDDHRYTVVGRGSSGRSRRDEDFGAVLGNLVFVGDDHAVGSALMPHQREPDRLGPSVNAVIPAAFAARQKSTTRIGVSFTDIVDPASLSSATFIVRPVGGSALPGRYSAQFGLANFAPAVPLAPDTTYEVIVPAGGVKDVAGNGAPRAFTSRFSTGPAVAAPLACTVRPTVATPVGVPAVLAVTITGTVAGEPLVSFHAGDDLAATPFTTSPATTHVYARPGHHTVIATVRDGRETATCSRLQTVYAPPSAEGPAASSTIVYDGSTDLAWVVDPDADRITAIDGGAHEKRMEVEVGAAPRTLARAPDGTIWVACQDDATITVVDGATGARRGSIALPPRSRPYGIAFAPDGSAGYVTLQGSGAVAELDPAARAVRRVVPLGAPVRGLAISGDSRRLLVTRFLSPADRGEVLELDARSLALERTIALASDPGPDSEAGGRGVPNLLSSIAISPDGSYALVPSSKDNTARGLARDGRPLTYESTVRTIVSQLDLASGAEALARRVDLNDRDLAQALAFSKFGDYIVVAVQGSGAVELLDAETRTVVSGLPDVGLAPRGVAFSTDFKRLYVDNYLSRTVTVHDASGLADASSVTLPLLATVRTVEVERLDPKVLRGKQIFNDAADRRMSLDGYLSCASCHLDGESDGRVWDFTSLGEGLRNTTTLAGHGGLAQGPLHWTGNFDEVQDFEQPIRELFGGRGFMDDAAYRAGTRARPFGDRKAGVSPDLDALAAYVSSLKAGHGSPLRREDGELTEEGERGRLVFERLRCGRCHAGTELTDSGTGILHDVGTLSPSSGHRLGRPLTGLDTPTLRGVWETPPYLHDGSAATLEDVLTTRNSAGLHGGDTASLGAEDLAALVAYLRQLD